MPGNLAMKLFCRLLLPLVFLGGCTSLSPLHDPGGELPSRAADGSSSTISEEQSLAIAKATIARREGWPENQLGADGLIHTVAYGSRRINNGGWRVVAHRAVTTARHADCGYDPIPPAVITINKRGRVSHYTRQYGVN